MSTSSSISPPERRLELVSVERQLTPPRAATGLVTRRRLLTTLRDTNAEVVSVIAPAGYGKTTLLAQWARSDTRPFAWLTMTDDDNDSSVLRSSLALALSSLDCGPDDAPGARPRSHTGPVAAIPPERGRIRPARSRPAVLVLDDVHLLQTSECGATLAALAKNLPQNLTLVLAGRSDTALPLGRALASGRVLRIGRVDLAMNAVDSVAVLQAAGIEQAADVGATVAARTEGWPVGLSLAALALGDQPDPVPVAERFGGDDRTVADYFEQEVLGPLPAVESGFVLRSSVLDVLSGPLCDAVLERSDSGQILEGLARSNSFLVPLDRHGGRYRYHRLFGEAVRSILARRDSSLAPALLGRASGWFAEHGDTDAAIQYAQRAGDTSAVAALAWSGASSYLGDGRSATVGRWLQPFTADEIGAQPALALTAAWWSLTTGQIDELEHWLSEAERAEVDAILPDGTPVRAATLLLRALAGRDGVAQVRADAALAFELNSPDSPYQSVARYLEGVALRLLGERTVARSRLEDSLVLATLAIPALQAHCLTQLALLAVDEDDWAAADELCRYAVRVVAEHRLRDRPAMAIQFAAVALSSARQADPTRARRAHDHAVALLGTLTSGPPWLLLETHLLLARSALLLGDVAAARTLIGESKGLATKCRDASALHEELADTAQMLEALPITNGFGAIMLTPAELRVLQHLPTQLTFSELGERLFVSRNTVKTQVHSVYRKLGVSSRTRAVERAREVGLLDR